MLKLVGCGKRMKSKETFRDEDFVWVCLVDNLRHAKEGDVLFPAARYTEHNWTHCGSMGEFWGVLCSDCVVKCGFKW